MKKDDEADDLLPEYDFHQMTGGERGKLAASYRQGHQPRAPRPKEDFTRAAQYVLRKNAEFHRRLS